MTTVSDSRREEGLRLLAEGCSVKEVATRLGVVPSTVYRWRDRPASAEGASEQALCAAHPRVIRKLIALAEDGDIRAIKEVLSRMDQIREAQPAPTDEEAEMALSLAVLDSELENVTPLLASQIMAVYVRVCQKLEKIHAGEIPPPPPVELEPSTHPAWLNDETLRGEIPVYRSQYE